MAGEDATLVYKARFDPSGVDSGLAKAEESFKKLDDTASRAFQDIERGAKKIEDTLSKGASVNGAAASLDKQTTLMKASADTQAKILQDQAQQRRNWEIENLNSYVQWAENLEGIEKDSYLARVKREMDSLDVTRDMLSKRSQLILAAANSDKEVAERAFQEIENGARKIDNALSSDGATSGAAASLEKQTSSMKNSAEVQARILAEQAEYRRHWQAEVINISLAAAEKLEGIDRESAVERAKRDMERLDITRDMLNQRSQLILTAANRDNDTFTKAEEDKARTQARYEREYEAAQYQADLAEAALVRNGWERKIAIQRVMMNKEMSEFVGNLDAQEQIQRKHNAIILSLQQQMAAATDRPERVILQRMGTVTAAANRAQGVLFGISPILGNLGGGLAQTSAGLMGISTAFQSVAATGAAALLPIAGWIAGLAAVGAAIAMVVKRRKELAELRENPEWLTDPAQYAAVTKALEGWRKASEDVKNAMPLQEAAKLAAAATGITTLLPRTSAQTLALADAQKKLMDMTGMTAEELNKFFDMFGGREEASKAFMAATQGRLVAVQNELRRAKIEADALQKTMQRRNAPEGVTRDRRAVQDELNIELAQEKARYEESVQAEKAALARSLVAIKEAGAEGEKARKETKAQSDKVLEQMEKVHLQNMSNLRADAAIRDAEVAEKEIKRVEKLMEDSRKKHADEVKKSEDEQARRITELNDSVLSEKKKLDLAMTDSEVSQLLIRQAHEREVLEARKASADALGDSAHDMLEKQQAAQALILQGQRHQIENNKMLISLQLQLVQGSLSLAASLAGVFNNTRLQRYVATTQQWLNILIQARAVAAGLAALNLFSGGAAGAASGLSFAPIPNAPPLGGAFADGGRPPLGKVSIVGERGPELFIPDAPGTIYSHEDSRRMVSVGGSQVTFGNINITVGSGGNPQEIERSVKVGIASALKQMERNRDARFYDNGTFSG